MYTKEEFIQRVRAKFPQYSKMNDDELYNQVIQKYPQYKEQIKEDSSYLGEVGGKILKGIENVPADIINIGAKAVGSDVRVSPISQMLSGDTSEYKGGLLQDIANKVSDRGSDLSGAIEQGGEAGLSNKAQGVYQGVGSVVGGVSDVVGEVFMSGLKTVTPDETQDSIKSYIGDKMKTTAVGQKIAGMMNDYTQNMEFLKKNDPEGYRNWKATFGYLSGIADAIGIKEVDGIYRTVSGEIKNIPTEALFKMQNDLTEKLSTGIKDMKDKVTSKVFNTDSKIKDIFSGMPITSKEYERAISPSGAEFDVEKTPTLFENINDAIFSKKLNEMAVKSIFPKQTKEKGINARLQSGEGKTALEGAEQLYDDKALGIVTADIHSMGGGVEGVGQGMEYWGKRIGELTNIDETVNFRQEIDDLSKSLDENFAKVNADMYSRVKGLVDIFNQVGDEVSVKDMQRALSNIKSDVFKNFETTKQLSGTSTGKALGKLLDKLEEKFNATIDITTGDSAELIKAKKAYSKYIKIQKDLVDSFLVDQRNTGKGLSGTAGALGGVYEFLQSPSLSSAIKGIALKQVGDMIGNAKSRGGNWEMLMRAMDRKSVINYKKGLKVNPDDIKGNTDDIIATVQDIASQIKDNIGNRQGLLNLREELSQFEEIPEKYRKILDEKIGNYIKNVDDYKKQVDELSTGGDSQYGEGLQKAFNSLQGIEKRVKSSKFDKQNQVEFQTSPAYKKFSDEAQSYINQTNSDMSVQELYDSMKGKTRYQTGGFQNKSGVTSFLMKQLEGKTTVSKQFIENVAKQQGVKQGEKVLIADTLSEFEGVDKINVEDFAKSFQEKMTVLEKRIMEGDEGKYSDYGNSQTPLQIAETLGEDAKYTEVVYNFNDFESNGSGHYSDPNYFGHIRNVDFQKDGENFRVISEKQSDLFQRGGEGFYNRKKQSEDFLKSQIGRINDAIIESEDNLKNPELSSEGRKFLENEIENMKSDLISYTKRLQNNTNPKEKYRFDLNLKEGHTRLTREEIQRAIDDGKDYLLFPKGKASAFYEGWLGLDGLNGNVGGGVNIDELKNIDIGREFEMFGESYVRVGNKFDEYGIEGVRREDITNEFDVDLAIDEDVQRLKDEAIYELRDEGINEGDDGFDEALKSKFEEMAPEMLDIEGGLKEGYYPSEYVNYLQDEIYTGDSTVSFDSESGMVYISNGDSQYFSYGEMEGEKMNPKDMTYDEVKEKAIDTAGSNGGGTMDYYEKILPKEVEKEAKKMGATIDMNYIDELGLDYVKVDLRGVKDKVGKPIDVFQREISGNQIDPMEAVKVVRKYFKPDQLGVEVVDKIITPEGLNAFGKYSDKLITFSKNPIDSTPEHEVLHAYFDMMLSTDKKARLLAEVKSRQKLESNIDAEEWLADNFVEFARGRNVKGISENIKKTISDLRNTLKRLFSEGDIIDNMYRDLEALGNKKDSKTLKVGAIAGVQQTQEEK